MLCMYTRISMGVWNYFGLYFVRLCCTNGEIYFVWHFKISMYFTEALFIYKPQVSCTMEINSPSQNTCGYLYAPFLHYCRAHIISGRKRTLYASAYCHKKAIILCKCCSRNIVFAALQNRNIYLSILGKLQGVTIAKNLSCVKASSGHIKEHNSYKSHI